MAGTGYHPEGHVTRPFPQGRHVCRNTEHGDGDHVICTNCAEVCPVDSECIDDY